MKYIDMNLKPTDYHSFFLYTSQQLYLFVHELLIHINDNDISKERVKLTWKKINDSIRDNIILLRRKKDSEEEENKDEELLASSKEYQELIRKNNILTDKLKDLEKKLFIEQGKQEVIEEIVKGKYEKKIRGLSESTKKLEIEIESLRLNNMKGKEIKEGMSNILNSVIRI